MTTVHLLTTSTHPNSFALNFPILRNRNQLKEHGFDVKLYQQLEAHLFECDILAINSKFFRPWWSSRENDIFEHLQTFQNKVHTTIWFDTADSSGTTQFKVLPFVKGYYKNQLLKDRKGYCKTYYGSRVFTDFYHKQFGIVDDEAFFTDCSASAEDLSKIGLSWNFGMGDYGPRAKNFARIRKLIPFIKSYSMHFAAPYQSRSIALTCRLGRSHGRPTIRFQRDKTVEILTEKFDIDTQRISQSQYFKEMQQAQICISPFGWGEMAYRDFEAIISGTALLKPDMSHLETWPNVYQPGKTYIPYKWDFSDFEDVLTDALANTQKCQEIAHHAQAIYRSAIHNSEEWRNRFVGLLKKHI